HPPTRGIAQVSTTTPEGHPSAGSRPPRQSGCRSGRRTDPPSSRTSGTGRAATAHDPGRTRPACAGYATRLFSAHRQSSSSPVFPNPRIGKTRWVTLAGEQHKTRVLRQLVPDLPGLVDAIRIRPARFASPEVKPDPRLIRADDTRVRLHNGWRCLRIELLPNRCPRSGVHHEKSAVVVLIVFAFADGVVGVDHEVLGPREQRGAVPYQHHIQVDAHEPVAEQVARFVAEHP